MNVSETVSHNRYNLHSESHVWFVNPETVSTHTQLEACRVLLSADEVQRHSRFRLPEVQHQYLVAHALVRRVLSQYWPIPPQDWVFSHSDRGKPLIANPGTPALRFNLTHTRALAACIVSLDVDCGIDAEQLSARHNPEDIAKRMFSADENAHLQRLSGVARLEYFYSCWTLREAYVKARGVGIAFPMHKLEFSFSDIHAIRVVFDSDINDNAALWDFQLFRPTAAHILATANRSGNQSVKVVRLNEFVF
jgi:4'-phosphopantetheinyl transferase